MKEISTTGSIQLTRIHAIHWYGFCDSFDLGGQTIITGVYGCGKTGLIDLIQTVLLGHPERENRYNLSLADIGNSSREEKRDLRGYCLQDLNLKSHGQPIYSRNNTRTYIALEFTWPDHKRRETWGLRIEYTSVGADADISYWRIPVRIEFSDFLGKGEVPLSAEEWEHFLNGHKERVFPSKPEYLEAMCAAQHLNFNARVFKPLLLQTLQFKFGKDFTEFCRSNILPDDPIHLETVRESYDRYRGLVARMRLLQEQEQVLQRIQEAFAKQKTLRDEISALEWFQRKFVASEAKSVWESADAKWARLRSAAEAWRLREAELQQRKKDAEKHLADGHELMRRTPNAGEFDGLKKQQHALPQEIAQLRATLDDPVADFRAKFKRFQELCDAGKKALRDFGWAQPTSFPALSEKLPVHLDTDALVSYISELLAAVDPLAMHFNRSAQSAEDDLRSLEGRASKLRGEISRIRDSLTAEELPLHEALTARLGPDGVHLLGNLCTIVDEEWTDALEINFGHKFSSVVADDKIKVAFGIFNSLQHTDARERLLCRKDMKALPGVVRPGSLAEKITSSEPAVRQLLAHLFGDVMCCRTVDEAEANPRSILPTGAIKQPTGRRRLRATPSEYAIGESGRLRMIERKEKEVKGLAPEIDTADRRAQAARALADGFQSIKVGLLQLSASKVRLLRELERKLSQQRDINRRLDLFENREQLEELQADLNTRIKEAEKISREIRDHNQEQPTEAVDAEREAALAREAYESAEVAWLKWQAGQPAALAAASRHLELEDEIKRETTPACPASVACKLLTSRRETLVAKTQSDLRAERLNLKQDTRFTDYRDIDENDFDDNNFFDKKLTYIRESGIKELADKATDAELEWEDRFQNQVLGQLQHKLSEIRETFNGLRRITAGRLIGGASYDFTYKSVDGPRFELLRRLAADREIDNLVPGSDPRFAEIKRNRRAAMESLTIPSAREGDDGSRVREATARVRELLDARCYFTYDMEITEAGRTEKISLAQRGRKGSGGETYNPYFIALTTAYLRAFHRHINKGRPSISLLVMDEAFKVLNSEAVRDCVQIIRELGLQGVISCTDTNGGQVVEFFQWAMIVQKRVIAGGASNGHDLIENTIYSAPRNDPEIRRLLDDIITDAPA
jgi:Putative exonuclease SbcCD, C subunit/P-loop containing region of AAA domain